MSLSEKKKKRLLTVIIVLSLIFMGLVTWFVGKPLVQFAKDPNGFRAWVNTHGIWGRVLYVGMIIFQVLVALIPGEPLEIAGGYAFGAWGGTLLCLLGATPGQHFGLFCWSAGGASGSWSCTSREKKLSP